jgi:hypothetical protein
VPRATLIDFFRDLVTIRGEFLVYDDGYRHRAYSYQEVGRAARGFAAKLDSPDTGGTEAESSTARSKNCRSAASSRLS